MNPTGYRHDMRILNQGNGSGRNPDLSVAGPLQNYHQMPLRITDKTSKDDAKNILNNWVDLMKTHRVGHLFDTDDGLSGHVEQIQYELNRLYNLVDGLENQDLVAVIAEAENKIYHAVESAKEANNADFLDLNFRLNSHRS